MTWCNRVRRAAAARAQRAVSSLMSWIPCTSLPPGTRRHQIRWHESMSDTKFPVRTCFGTVTRSMTQTDNIGSHDAGITKARLGSSQIPIGKSLPAVIDTARSVSHQLGAVPIVWIRNLPGSPTTGDNADGACTFAAAMHSQVEIDYQLSQVGRGLKYSSDPTLLLKDPSLPDGELIKRCR